MAERAGIARRRRAAGRSGTRKWGADLTPEQLAERKAAKRAKGAEVSAERAGAALESVLALVESGDLPNAIARTWIARVEGLSPMVHWSLGNQLLALLAGTCDARGYRQWQEAGRHVVKGAKAFHILGPSTRKVEDRETGEERVIVLGFHPIPVFRFEDTEGFPLEQPDYDPPAPAPLTEVARSWGIAVEYVPNVGQSWLGLYRHKRDAEGDGSERIMLAAHAEQVFFHELAHAAHQRVLRAAGKDLADVSSDRKELVAELTAATLGQLHGLELSELAWSREYLQSHAGAKSVGSACMGVLSEVQSCLTAILTESEGT